MPPPLPPDRRSDRRRAIGDQMRQARLHASLSQQTVAERAGIERDSYGRIERGQASPLLDTLLDIADAIGVPLAHLVRDE